MKNYGGTEKPLPIYMVRIPFCPFACLLTVPLTILFLASSPSLPFKCCFCYGSRIAVRCALRGLVEAYFRLRTSLPRRPFLPYISLHAPRLVQIPRHPIRHDTISLRRMDMVVRHGCLDHDSVDRFARKTPFSRRHG